MIGAYIELTKPRITWLILMSTGVGFFFGVRETWSWAVLMHALVGTALIASGTAALNQWWERIADAKMHRTKERPLPSGRLRSDPALIFAVALSLAGFLELLLWVNSLTGWLGLFTLATYLFLYTPLKQRSPHSTTIGAIPGAMPPLIGYAAAHGTLTAEAWILFAILFLWQFPHFYAIAWIYRDDYARAGIRMLPVIDESGESTVRQILVTAVLLLPVSLLPRYLGMSGDVYLGGAALLSLYYLYTGWQIRTERTPTQARRVLLASIVYLPLLYALMVVDRPQL